MWGQILLGIMILVVVVNLPMTFTVRSSVDRANGALQMQFEYIFFRGSKAWRWSWAQLGKSRSATPVWRHSADQILMSNKKWLMAVGQRFFTGISWQRLHFFGNVPLVFYPWVSVVYGISCAIVAMVEAKTTHRLPLTFAIEPTQENGSLHGECCFSTTPAHLLLVALWSVGGVFWQWCKRFSANRRRQAIYYERSAYQ